MYRPDELDGGISMIRNADGTIKGMVTWVLNVPGDDGWRALGCGEAVTEEEARQALRSFTNAILAADGWNARKGLK